MIDGLAMASAQSSDAATSAGQRPVSLTAHRPLIVPDAMATSARWIALAGGLTGILIGGSALLGYAYEIPALYNWRDDLGSVVPNTALVILLLGVSIVCQVFSAFAGRLWLIGIGLAACSFLMMMMAIAEHGLDVTLQIGGFKFDDMLMGGNVTFENPDRTFRSGIGAAATLAMASLSVALLGTRSRIALCASTCCTVISMTLSLTVVMGFGFAVRDYSVFWAMFEMSLQATIGAMGVLMGVVMARPDRPAARTMLSRLAGGVTARRLLPFCVCVPVLLAIIYSIGKRFALVEYNSGAAIVTSLVIVMMTLMVQVSSAALNRSDQRRRAAEARQLRLMDELDHRVKNNLAAVLALFDQTVVHTRDSKTLQATFRERLVAMARAHEALAASQWRSVSLAAMIETVVAPFAGPGAKRLVRSGAAAELPANAVLPLAVTLSELATNATKYGAFSPDALAGKVELKWETVDSTLLMEWVEKGGPVPGQSSDRPASTGSEPAPAGRGFGVTLIEGMIAHELGGKATVSFEPTGVRCTIRVPIASECVNEVG